MGLFDKAKDAVTQKLNRAGEETVRVVDYDEEAKAKGNEPAFESSFDTDEADAGFFAKGQKLWDRQKGGGDSPDPHVQAGKIQDVLELLKIQPTFELSASTLMPDDLKDIEFDLQIPQGYDTGQVDAFLQQVRGSLREYLKFLKQRNEDLAKIASVTDKLQVDAHNLKYDAQIAEGISIMPTDDSGALEAEILELRLSNKNLSDQLDEIKTGSELSVKERGIYENMRNEWGAIQRELEDKDEEIDNLKTKLAAVEQELDEYVEREISGGLSSPPQQVEHTVEEELPAFVDSPEVDNTSSAFGSSAFDTDEDLPEQSAEASAIEYLDDEGEAKPLSKAAEEDDDDELERMMKEWNN